MVLLIQGSNTELFCLPSKTGSALKMMNLEKVLTI